MNSKYLPGSAAISAEMFPCKIPKLIFPLNRSLLARLIIFTFSALGLSKYGKSLISIFGLVCERGSGFRGWNQVKKLLFDSSKFQSSIDFLTSEVVQSDSTGQ